MSIFYHGTLAHSCAGLHVNGCKMYVVPYSDPVPYSGTKDRYRAMDRYSRWSYRRKRPVVRFAVAVHSPIAVHGPITVQPEFFKFPRRNVPLAFGISLSTDFRAFSSFRRETCESTSLRLSTDFRAFSRTKESLARAIWHLRTVRSLVSFLFFLFDTERCLFKRRREKVWRGTPWFKEGNTHQETNLFSKCQLIAVRTRSLGGLSPRSVCSCAQKRPSPKVQWRSGDWS